MKLFNKIEYKEYRKKLRNDPTSPEFFLWLYLKEDKIGVKFRRQYGIGPFIVDFCCPKKKLVIEVDGLIHNKPDIKKYDFERQKFIESVGFTVVRFSNREVYENTQEILKKIKIILNQI